MMARPPDADRCPETVYRAVEMYVNGDKVSDIAKACDMSQTTVSYWAKKNGEALFGARFSVRTRGRRTEETPTERDQEILWKVLAGMPAAAIGREYNLSRARVSYIVKTWKERGYQAEIPYKPGMVVAEPVDAKNLGCARYLITELKGTTGAIVRQIVAWDEKARKVRTTIPGLQMRMKWWGGEYLCDIVHDTPTS